MQDIPQQLKADQQQQGEQQQGADAGEGKRHRKELLPQAEAARATMAAREERNPLGHYFQDGCAP